MRCRWCTFDNAKRWLEEIALAVINDLLRTLCWISSPDTQTRLNCFIAKSAASGATLVVSGLDGSELTFESSGPFITVLEGTHRGPNPQGRRSFIRLAPTTFLVLPPHFLTGKPVWTREKVDSLQLFSSHVSLPVMKPQHEAFHEGMRNAIIQRHYDALLTLVWLGTRMAEFGASQALVAASYDENPFKPPREMFRLVAKQGMRPFAATSDEHSRYAGKNNEAEISLWLFVLLLRAHAEGMPQNDPDIEAWANQLSTCQDSDGTVRALAQWVVDWKSDYGKRNPGRFGQPFFREGRLSRRGKDHEMGIRFEEILGGEVLGVVETTVSEIAFALRRTEEELRWNCGAWLS